MSQWTSRCGPALGVATLLVSITLAGPVAACKRHIAHHKTVHHKVVRRKAAPAHVAFHRTAAPKPAIPVPGPAPVRTVYVNRTVYVDRPVVVYRTAAIRECPPARYHTRQVYAGAIGYTERCPPVVREDVRYRSVSYRKPCYDESSYRARYSRDSAYEARYFRESTVRVRYDRDTERRERKCRDESWR